MATRVSPPQNKTYYINPAYLTFVENSGYGANLIQVSASSSCYISVYDPSNGIGYSDADRNYKRWKVTAYNNKFPSDTTEQLGKWYIYVRLEKNGTSALVMYDQALRGVKGGLITVTTDESGNEVYTEEEVDEETAIHYYIRIGEVGATDGTSIREITYDTGYLTSDEAWNDKSGESEMWKLDKYSFINPLIQALYWLKDFTVKGFITLVGGLIFKNDNGVEKPVVDLKRSTDSDYEYIPDENGNPVLNPDYVPTNDETIPTTAWVAQQSSDRYLKKYEPDETQHRIKFYDGVECGEFVKGPLRVLGGSGTQFDGDGYGEMNGLTLREFLEVPELRFNRIDVVSGILWNSIAFGLVESVDTANRICRLKLEDGERCGLHVYDICMGIFSDFGDGTVEEVFDEDGNVIDPGHDANGLPRMYGFRTSYFTPTKILVNEAGAFEFKYDLQEGTTVHPCQSMKFAVYGNFVDKSRQASAYSTRTYKRYMNNVDTWVINTTKNVYAQYGDLTDLTIGGQALSGYGSFQHNVYLTGAVFEFTPQQKEELKGSDAYTVVLSDYEGIVVIDDEGNIIGGELEVMNVVTDGQNVTTGGQNVVTASYKLNTSVIAMRGETPLHYALTTEKDGYVIALSPVGCSAAVLNGLVVVTDVTEPDNCHVGITVNCEGKSSFKLDYHITAVNDGKNPIFADIDNEVDAVACDAEGNVTFGLPVSCTVSVWAGTRQLVIDRMDVEAPEGVTTALKYVDQNGTDIGELDEEGIAAIEYTEAVLSVTDITKEAARALPVNLTVYASYGGTQYHKDLVFTVNKISQGENAVIYKLLPSVGHVSKDKEDNLSVDSVSCKVVGFDGKKTVEVDGLPDGVTMDCRVDDGDFASYTPDTAVSIDKDNGEVTFRLFQEQDGNSTQIDLETILIVRDGVETNNVIAYIRSNETPDTPTGGDFKNPKPTSSPEWFLSAPAGEEILWGSFRTFTSNGLAPQDEEWSEPRQLTDTASLKMIWSSEESPSPLVETPPEFNSDWTDDPTGDAVWMAVSSKLNGKWSPWAVSKIKGADALSLVASTNTVSRNSFGTYVPSTVRIRAMRAGVDEEVYFSAWGMREDTSTSSILLDGNGLPVSVHASELDIEMNTLQSLDFELLVIRAYDREVTDFSNTACLAQTVINFTGDGASGPMSRNCGEWSVTKTYYYNNEYRDFVWITTEKAGVKLFLRDGFGNKVYDQQDAMGGTTVAPPTSSNSDGTYGNDYWVEVPKTVMTAIDTALIDNANIAGFTFTVDHIDEDTGYPIGVLQDQNGRIILDAATGKLTCKEAEIDGNLVVRNFSNNVLYGGGSLEGYAMGVGSGVYILPSLGMGENRQVSVYLTYTDGDAAKSATVQVSDMYQPLWIYDEETESNMTVYSINLAYNTVYTFYGVGGTYFFNGQQVSGYWIVNSLHGGSVTTVSPITVDTSVISDSVNPVSGGAVYTALANKIQKVPSSTEATDPGILYIITSNA